jgi:hypothetical protein
MPAIIVKKNLIFSCGLNPLPLSETPNVGNSAPGYIPINAGK